VLGAFKASRGRGFITDSVALEVLTVLAKHLRTKQLSKRTYRTALAEFYRDYPVAFGLAEVNDSVRQRSLSFAETYRDIGAGAMDLLHLASALHVQQLARPRAVVLASADAALPEIARKEGLLIFNREKDPLAELMALLR
jgi:hypothetical protein